MKIYVKSSKDNPYHVYSVNGKIVKRNSRGAWELVDYINRKRNIEYMETTAKSENQARVFLLHRYLKDHGISNMGQYRLEGNIAVKQPPKEEEPSNIEGPELDSENPKYEQLRIPFDD